MFTSVVGADSGAAAAAASVYWACAAIIQEADTASTTGITSGVVFDPLVLVLAAVVDVEVELEVEPEVESFVGVLVVGIMPGAAIDGAPVPISMCVVTAGVVGSPPPQILRTKVGSVLHTALLDFLLRFLPAADDLRWHSPERE